MTEETRDCPDCGAAFTRRTPTSRWPVRCADCRAARGRASRSTERAESAETSPVDVLQLIANAGLDYCVGSAVRWLLESREDGDELESLRTARTYLERAIQAREEAA